MAFLPDSRTSPERGRSGPQSHAPSEFAGMRLVDPSFRRANRMRIPFPHCQMLPECDSYVNYLEATRPTSRSSQPTAAAPSPTWSPGSKFLSTPSAWAGRLEANCHGCSPSVNFAGVVELLQYISDSYNYSNIRINRVRDATWRAEAEAPLKVTDVSREFSRGVLLKFNVSAPRADTLCYKIGVACRAGWVFSCVWGIRTTFLSWTTTGSCASFWSDTLPGAGHHGGQRPADARGPR